MVANEIGGGISADTVDKYWKEFRRNLRLARLV